MALRVTLRDVAQAMGVHPSTVSRALRGDPRISGEVRDRVISAAERLGYRPDPALARLNEYQERATSVSDRIQRLSIGLMRPAQCLTKEALAQPQKIAERLGYRLATLDTTTIVDIDALQTEYHERKLAGLIMDSNRPCPPLRHLDGLRVVWLGIDAEPGVPAIALDLAWMIRIAYERAYQSGYRRIGIALHTGPVYARAYFALGAIYQAQDYHRPQCDVIPPFECTGSLKQPLIKKSFRDWLYAHQPEVLIGHDPSFYWQARDIGLTIPHQMAFIALTEAGSDEHIAGGDLGTLDAVLTSLPLIDHLYRRGKTIPMSDEHLRLLRPQWQEGASFTRRHVRSQRPPTLVPVTRPPRSRS